MGKDKKMGYMRHHAIVVTSWDRSLIAKAHEQAVKLGAIVTELTDVDKSCNGYSSFLVAPDGSKEGWEESEKGDEQRDKLVEWMDQQRYDDGSSALGWVEVQFDDDEKQTLVTRHSDEQDRFKAYCEENP
jgi:hypothetical protein